ncbi:MAG: SurA N-terminal domain-containing protein [Rhodobacteraceae bacterium]|nr:SurA N-terminal domain-containing protein [Paracoccaceae bacterium]
MRLSPLRPALLLVILTLAAAVTGPLTSTRAAAQSPFAAALYVNDDAITNYEITQKMRFLEFIGASGDDARQRAIDRLIEDRLQYQEATRLGGRLTPDQVQAGMAEFASRANLTSDEMISRMQQAGIDRETFENFIRAGVLWRELIRAAYGSQITVTEAQIDQALSVEGIQPSTEVLISEIFLPADPQFAEAVSRIIPQIQRIRTEAEFSNAARQVSAAPSGPSGGRVDRWINVQAMPPEVGGAFASAAPGTVIGPIELPGAHAFFQLRARRDSRAVPANVTELEYREVLLPGGHSDANQARVARIREAVDSCVDFDAQVLREVPELPADAVQHVTRTLADLSGAQRTELERLNPGQISANLLQGNALVVMMLCNRSVGGDAAPPRAQVREALVNRALEGQAAIYLQRLRAEADIRYP